MTINLVTDGVQTLLETALFWDRVSLFFPFQNLLQLNNGIDVSKYSGIRNTIEWHRTLVSIVPPCKWKVWIFRIKAESNTETQSLRTCVPFSKTWPKAASFLVKGDLALSQRVYTITLGSAHELLDSSLGLSLLSIFAFWMLFKKTPHTKKGSSLCTDDIWRKPL